VSFLRCRIICKFQTLTISSNNSSNPIRLIINGLIEWALQLGPVRSNNPLWDIKNRLIFKASYNTRKEWEHSIVVLLLLKLHIISRDLTPKLFIMEISRHKVSNSTNNLISKPLITKPLRYLSEVYLPSTINFIRLTTFLSSRQGSRFPLLWWFTSNPSLICHLLKFR